MYLGLVYPNIYQVLRTKKIKYVVSSGATDPAKGSARQLLDVTNHPVGDISEPTLLSPQRYATDHLSPSWAEAMRRDIFVCSQIAARSSALSFFSADAAVMV